ncbi:MAG: class I SAM-dependent DNA methyltransferase, partial [Janthinobacterium lividum]
DRFPVAGGAARGVRGALRGIPAVMSEQSWSGDVFDRLYAEHPDPWGFETSPYERDKYAATLAALGNRHFGFILELGCSIGVMTAALAPRCDRLLGIDIAEAALARARERCAPFPHVGFKQARLPDEFPDLAHECDLILVSELLYFLSPADIGRLAACVLRALAPGGMVVLVNWTGETNTPCTGDQASELFIAACGLPVGYDTRSTSYRLDRLS